MAEVCMMDFNEKEFNFDENEGVVDLFHAAKEDLPDVVKRLKSNGLDLDITDNKGKTAVFYANQKGSSDALCALIECGATSRLDEIDGKAVLFHAAKEDYSGVVDRLYSNGLDLNITDDAGRTAVFHANRNGSIDILCELIGHDATFNLDEIDGKAVLFHAAKNDYYLVVDILERRGLDLNITDGNDRTAVFCANLEHKMDSLCTLIAAGADFNLDEIDAKATLFHAAKEDYANVVNRLYSKGLDLNITDHEGRTAATYAKEGMFCFPDLIRCGAKFNLDEINGRRVLFDTILFDRPELVKPLYDAGVDLDIIVYHGKTGVLFANEKQRLDVLCELIQCDATFNLNEIDGKAALFYAAKANIKEVVKPLYDAGLDLNITDDKGKTVVFYCNKHFLDALLAVDEVLVNARDAYGRTPLFYALQDDDTTRARHLIEKGGNSQLKDNCNISIFSFFIEYCIFKKIEALQLFTTELFKEEHQLKALTLAILDSVYCQAPLLSISGSPHLLKSFAIFNKTNLLKALAFAQNQFSMQDADNAKNVEKISSMISENGIDVPLILSLLNKLGANPNAVDSDGNTALHYASFLPFLGVTQKTVIEICKKLRKFGASFDTRNHQRQSPLLFSLSSIVITEDSNWQSSIEGLVDVCKFLLSNGSSTTNGSGNGESIFHRIILLIQQGLQLNEEALRELVLKVLIRVLELLSPKEDVINAVNNIDTLLNSPLHLWASIALKSPQDYASFRTGEFKNILKKVMDHLLKCGAKLNPRNANEQTPLHLCRTWTAVKLLLGAGANPNDVDSSGHSVLLVAAKDKSYFYADVNVIEHAETFWESAIEMGLDLWIADQQKESLLSVLIKSEDVVLARALVQVACKEKHATNYMKLSLLEVISKDESKHTHWKTIMVQDILKSAKVPPRLSLDLPLRSCCENIVKFGMFDEKEDSNSTHQKAKDEQCDDGGQLPSKKRKKDESIKEQKEKEEPNEGIIRYYSVHRKIADEFISYGGEPCLNIAKGYGPLKDFVKSTEEIESSDYSIPWNSISDKYKGLLREVAKRPKCRLADQICHRNDVIGRGSFGHILAGINKKDGREVAVKCIRKSSMLRPQDTREIKNLTVLADCEQVVRYIQFVDGNEDENLSYIVLELMEGNLKEYLDESKIDVTQATLRCKDLVMGLAFLHGQNILHRDLKPENILYKVHPKTCLKIADFGLSIAINGVATTVYHTNAGTRCWIAPEVLTSKPDSVDKNRFGPASDIFSCGLLLHYILSGQKHPFNPSNASKGVIGGPSQTEVNIMNDKMVGWDDSLPSEATHLIKRMLQKNEMDRPSAEKALEHPLFWSKEKKLDFLKAVAAQKEFQLSSKGRSLTKVETDLKANIKIILKHGSWINKQYEQTKGIYEGMIQGKRARKNYDRYSVVDLVRFIRNVYEHYEEKTFSNKLNPIRKRLFEDFVFLDDFPDLVMEVYKAVTTHGWDKTRDEVKLAVSNK